MHRAGYFDEFIRRCWSAWNVLCTCLFTAELFPANPMPQVGRPKTNKMPPKALHHNVVSKVADPDH